MNNRMRWVDGLSVVLGLVWNVIAMVLLGKVADAFRPSWLLAGVLAGVVSGRFAIASRSRRGAEHLLDILANYYLGIVVYWLGWVVVEFVSMVWERGWTGFHLHDYLILGFWFVVQGTFPYGILLIPLCLLSRRLVWSVYARPGS